MISLSPHQSAFLASSGVIKKGREIFDALVAALDDESVDNRGDVGSWVREAALKALEWWTRRIAALTPSCPELFAPDMSQVINILFCSSGGIMALIFLLDREETVRPTSARINGEN